MRIEPVPTPEEAAAIAAALAVIAAERRQQAATDERPPGSPWRHGTARPRPPRWGDWWRH